jgi:hypothetical protein
MGSRVMHYYISSLLSEALDIKNKSEFMLGGIAPDIHGLMGVPKGVTHFKDRDANGRGFINYERFYNTYKTVIDVPFYLGYLCHLISDFVYLDFYFKKLEDVPTEQMNAKLQVAYRDFERLNGRIIKQYSLVLHPHVIPTVNIEGYDTSYLPALLDCMQKDFSIDEDLMNEPLELFQNDNSEIIEYIHSSVDKAVSFIS